MKFKVQVKVNFTVAERCHYHHATRAHKALRLRFYKPIWRTTVRLLGLMTIT